VTLVVRRRRPLLTSLSILLVAAGIGVGGWWWLEGERSLARFELRELRQEHAALQRSHGALVREREALARRLAIVERERQVEQSAYRRVDAELEALHAEILGLKEDLAFYRGIVADESAGDGVRIQRFVVEPEGLPGDYVFRLVLTRGMRSDNVARGIVSLSIDGDHDGEPRRLGLTELSPLAASPLSFRFRHFQRIEGLFRLPERFTPRRVVIEVEVGEDEAEPLRRTYAWPPKPTSTRS
jgi:hypothetical protein